MSAAPAGCTPRGTTAPAAAARSPGCVLAGPPRRTRARAHRPPPAGAQEGAATRESGTPASALAMAPARAAVVVASALAVAAAAPHTPARPRRPAAPPLVHNSPFLARRRGRAIVCAAATYPAAGDQSAYCRLAARARPAGI